MKHKFSKVFFVIVMVLIVSLVAVACDDKPGNPKKYAVSYSGGEGITGTAPAGGEYAKDATVTIPGAGTLSKTNYTFGGWSYNGTTYHEGDSFTMPANAVTFTAVWTPTGNGGGGDDDDDNTTKYSVTVIKSANDSLTQSVVGTVPTVADQAEGATFTIPANALSLPHYTLSKWRVLVLHTPTVEEGGEPYWETLQNYDPTAQIEMPAQNIKVAAVWTPNKVTISFNSNGGTGTMTSIQKDYATNMALNTTDYECAFTAPANKEFAGWSNTSSGSALANGTKLSEPIVSSTDTLTLYAVWSNTDPSGYVNPVNAIEGVWTVSGHELQIVADSQATEASNVIGYAVIDGVACNVCPEQGGIILSSLDGNTGYALLLDGSTLTAAEYYTTNSIAFTSKTSIINSNISNFVGKWLRAGTQKWVIEEDYAYWGLNLTRTDITIVGDYIILSYEVQGYPYILTVKKDGNNLVGKFCRNEADPQDTTFTQGTFLTLYVEGALNQMVDSGHAPDADKIENVKPNAPSGQKFSKWVITGTETEFNPANVMTADVSISAAWVEDSDPQPTVAFDGYCKTPEITGSGAVIGGGDTFVKLTIDFNTLAVTYVLVDGTEKTVNATNAQYPNWKPTTYGNDALYYDITMEGVSYHILVKVDYTKMSLCDNDDEVLDDGEFIMRDPNSEWVAIDVEEGSDFYTLAQNKAKFYFNEELTNGATTFVGLQFDKNSLGICLRTIYMSSGSEKTLTTTIPMTGLSEENGCLRVFSTTSYNIVLGQKTDGNYYIVSFKYKATSEADTTGRVLVAPSTAKTYVGSVTYSGKTISKIEIDLSDNSVKFTYQAMVGGVQTYDSTLIAYDNDYYVEDTCVGEALWLCVSGDGNSLTIYDDYNDEPYEDQGTLTLQA